MGVLARAKTLFKNDSFVGYCNTYEGINCEKIDGTPKRVWLVTGYDGYWGITFTDPQDPNAVSGTWLSIDGMGYVIDGAIDNLLAACNNCCGSTPTITPIIDGNFPNVNVLPTTFTVNRTDDGDTSAQDDFALDYMDYAVAGSVARTGRNNGVTTYTFQSIKDPVPQGDDTITVTARVFNSNNVAALSANQQYNTKVVVNGGLVGDPINSASLADAVTALNSNAATSALGTWSKDGGSTHLILTTTAVNNATIAVKIIPTT